MKVELIQNTNGIFEIWADNRYIKMIIRNKGEVLSDYKRKADDEYEDYLKKLRNMSSGNTSKTIRSETI